MFTRLKTADPIVQFARRWSKWPMYSALVLSLFIATVVPEESLRHSEVAASLVAFVSRIVPAIDSTTAVSHFPVLTAVIFSMNWLFVPLYVVATVLSYGFWCDDVKTDFLNRWRALKRTRLQAVGIVLFVIVLLLSDWNVIPAFGAYHMGAASFAYKMGLLSVLDTHPVGIALLYWAMGVFEGVLYGGSLAALGIWIYSFLKKKHLIRHQV